MMSPVLGYSELLCVAGLLPFASGKTGIGARAASGRHQRPVLLPHFTGRRHGRPTPPVKAFHPLCRILKGLRTRLYPLGKEDSVQGSPLTATPPITTSRWVAVVDRTN